MSDGWFCREDLPRTRSGHCISRIKRRSSQRPLIVTRKYFCDRTVSKISEQLSNEWLESMRRNGFNSMISGWEEHRQRRRLLSHIRTASNML
jgi:hypothetical protein